MTSNEIWETISAAPMDGKHWRNMFTERGYEGQESCPALLVQEHRFSIDAQGHSVEQARPYRTRCVFAATAGGELAPALDRANYLRTEFQPGNRG